MFPLSQDLLLVLKLFVFFTCIFFWIRLAYQHLMRGHRLRSHPPHQRRPLKEE